MITIPGISEESLVSKFPSIFQESPADHVSDRYSFVNTKKAVDKLCEAGFMVSEVLGSTNPKGKHIVRMRHIDYMEVKEGSIPELIVVNSHDWSSSFQLCLGIFRLVCENGMIVVSNNVSSFKSKHSGIGDINQILSSFSVASDKAFEYINRWKTIQTTNVLAKELAREAAKIRWHQDISEDVAEKLITVRRRGDDLDSLWGIFNVIQENLLNGGFRNPASNRVVKEIRNPSQVKTFNEELWKIGDKYANLIISESAHA